MISHDTDLDVKCINSAHERYKSLDDDGMFTTQQHVNLVESGKNNSDNTPIRRWPADYALAIAWIVGCTPTRVIKKDDIN